SPSHIFSSIPPIYNRLRYPLRHSYNPFLPPCALLIFSLSFVLLLLFRVLLPAGLLQTRILLLNAFLQALAVLFQSLKQRFIRRGKDLGSEQSCVRASVDRNRGHRNPAGHLYDGIKGI